MKNSEVQINGEYVLNGERVRVIEILNVAIAVESVSMREAKSPGHCFPQCSDEDWKVRISFIGTDKTDSVKVGELRPVPT